MSVASPPRPPDVDTGPKHDPVEALIEEARRRTRRRRRRYGLGGFAALGVIVVSVGFVGGRDAVTSGGARSRTTTRVAPFRAGGGELTIMEAEVNSKGKALAGWYVASTIGSDGHLRKLARCPDHAKWCGEVVSIDWAPDGTRLALSVTSFGSANPYNGLRVVDIATGRDRMVRAFRPREGDAKDVDWSPDGSRLAYANDDGIRVVLAGGSSSPRRLISGRRPSWSPDGRRIAFARHEAGRWSIRVIGADGLRERVVVPRGGASAPAWSPDGRTIAYRHGCKILMTTPAGVDVTPPRLRRCIELGRPVEKFAGSIGPPVWSPDGTKLAFSAGGRGTFVMNEDGSGLQRVTEKTVGCWCGQQPRPAWRPIS